MITVFYDGKCGLCRREIGYYKRIAPKNTFDWVDITVDRTAVKKLGISYADSLKLFHVQDQKGQLHVGVDGFILIWQQIPGWRLLAKAFEMPFVRPVANKAYDLFAEWRFKRLTHCQIAAQEEKSQEKSGALNPPATSSLPTQNLTQHFEPAEKNNTDYSRSALPEQKQPQPFSRL